MKTTELKADFKPLKQAIYEALSLAQSPHLTIKLRRSVFNMLSQSIIEGSCFSNHLCSIKRMATRGAGEYRLVFEPSKRLSELVATLVALDSKSRITRKSRFGHCLTPNSRVNDKGGRFGRPKSLPTIIKNRLNEGKTEKNTLK